MGSVVAGIKAGAVASLYYAGSVSLFNALLLLIFRQQTLSYLSQNFPTTCGASAAQSCFTDLVIADIPISDFVRIGVVAILFALCIGVYFDYLPGPTYLRKMVLGTMIMFVAMLFLGIYGLVTSQLQAAIMIAFEACASIPYAVFMARFYRRFTREVEFKSERGGRIFVDKRDMTGKKRTFGLGSKHTIEVAGNTKPFKGWLVSGGVQVKEPKEQKTSMKVTGDGLLRLA